MQSGRKPQQPSKNRMRDWPKAVTGRLERGSSLKIIMKLIMFPFYYFIKTHYSKMRLWLGIIMIEWSICYFCHIVLNFVILPTSFSSINNTWILLVGKWPFPDRYSLITSIKRTHFPPFSAISTKRQILTGISDSGGGVPAPDDLIRLSAVTSTISKAALILIFQIFFISF